MYESWGSNKKLKLAEWEKRLKNETGYAIHISQPWSYESGNPLSFTDQSTDIDKT